MAFGDVGGAVTELVITCRTAAAGTVAISKGDALVLTGPYTVEHASADEEPVFGQALADADTNDTAIPVKVRGICIFAYTGAAPTVNGSAGILASATAGTVKTPLAGNGSGLNVKADTTATEVHVLL
jgi:hypothetical protein